MAYSAAIIWAALSVLGVVTLWNVTVTAQSPIGGGERPPMGGPVPGGGGPVPGGVVGTGGGYESEGRFVWPTKVSTLVCYTILAICSH